MGYAEVYQFHRAAGVQRREQQVVGLDVVMRDAAPARPRRLQRQRRLIRYRRGVNGVYGTAPDQLARGVGDVLDGDEVSAVMLANLGYDGDVRVADGRHNPPLAPKALDDVGRRQMRMQDFQRHLALQCRVVCAIDRPLTAGAEPCDNSVLADHLLRRVCH